MSLLIVRKVTIEWVVQPYLAGQSVSLSLMVGIDCVSLVGANIQRVVQMMMGFCYWVVLLMDLRQPN